LSWYPLPTKQLDFYSFYLFQWRSQGVVLGVQTPPPLALKKICFYCMILILLFLLLFNIILVFSMYGCGTLFGDRRVLIAPTTERSHIYSELYKHMYMSMACMYDPTTATGNIVLFILLSIILLYHILSCYWETESWLYSTVQVSSVVCWSVTVKFLTV
jgi:hypothetical protein